MVKFYSIPLLAFLLLQNHASQAQKHDYIWLGSYYPTNSMVDFNIFPPKIYPLQINYPMYLENLPISDAEGNLIFYSNGCNIRNRENKTMRGGDSLNFGADYDLYCLSGSYSFSHGIIALPFHNDYHVFQIRNGDWDSLNARCGAMDLLWTKIDMNRQNGLGEVLFKDSLVLSDCFQRICAARHANGRDWWIFAPTNNSDLIYRFLLQPDGLSGPWVQQITNPTAYNGPFYGWAATSPDGKKIVLCGAFSKAAVYDLDRCSGLLSNLFVLHQNPYGHAFGFSPDSRYVYMSTDTVTRIYQYDLYAKDPAASGIQVAFTEYPFGSNINQNIFNVFLNGPDGKIYVTNGGRTNLHRIDFPNRRGLACGMRRAVLTLPGSNFGIGIYYPNYRLGPLDRSPCDTLGLDNRPVALFRHDLEDTLQPLRLTFTDLSYYEPAEWRWDFGDPGSGSANMSQDTSPVHIFSKPGLYTVCLIVKNEYAADTFCRQVSVGFVDAVENLPLLPRVAVSPNPFTDVFRVSLPALVPGARARFALYDALGQRVRDLALTDFETEVATGDLPAGLYYWTFSLREQAVQGGRAVLLR